MQDIWYGDRRDRVKWGAIVWLAKQHGIKDVLQVAYYRETTPRKFNIDGEEADLPQEVWNHFSNIKDIKNLGEQVGIEIDVIEENFHPSRRSEYVRNVVNAIQQYGDKPLIVFPDPDTGIADNNIEAEHASINDIAHIWNALKPGDWLIMYQHASRNVGWLEGKRNTFAQTCGGNKVITIQGPDIAKDVAFFAARKPGLAHPARAETPNASRASQSDRTYWRTSQIRKLSTTIAVGVFALVALLHVLRLVFGWEVMIQGSSVPMWVSVVGVVIAGSLAIMLWRETPN